MEDPPKAPSLGSWVPPDASSPLPRVAASFRGGGAARCPAGLRSLRATAASLPLLPPSHLCPTVFQPLELLCEKSIGTANRPMGAGEALRRVLECLASGIVMPG